MMMIIIIIIILLLLLLLINNGDKTQGGFRLELMQYDAAGNVNMTYNLTSPAEGFVGANNSTLVNRKVKKII